MTINTYKVEYLCFDKKVGHNRIERSFKMRVTHRLGVELALIGVMTRSESVLSVHSE